MLSLANARSEEDMRAWEKRIANLLKRFDITAAETSYVTEPKIDGLAISLIYENGKLIRGVTRGDGRVGEDVTHNLLTIGDIPKEIPDAPPMIEVRGEIYYPRSGFVRMNEERAEAGESTFANPRNAAAGTIRQLDPKIAASRPLAMWCYGIGHREGVEHETHHDEIEWLRERGFAVEDEIERHEGIDSVVSKCKWWEDRRESLDYEIDGVVVKVNERALWRELGVVGREPRWAIAWKFPPITATTELKHVVWNVGRVGNLIPFAQLDPVQVGGVTVSQATLHNEEDLARKDVREGDIVVVTRAGRRDSAGDRAADPAPRGQAPAQGQAAEEVPALRDADRQARRLGLHDLPEPPRLPRPDLPAHQALHRGHGHRGLRREALLPLPGRGPDRGPGGRLRHHGGEAHRARGLRRDLGPEPQGRDRRLAASSRSRSSSSRSACPASAT